MTGPNRLPRFVCPIPYLHLGYLLLGSALHGFGIMIHLNLIMYYYHLLLLIYLLCMIRSLCLIGTWRTNRENSEP
jgi:hypothetical protein